MADIRGSHFVVLLQGRDRAWRSLNPRHLEQNLANGCSIPICWKNKKAPSSVVMFKLMAHVLKPSLVLSIQTKIPLSDAYPLIVSFLQPLRASLSHQIQIVFIFFKPRKLISFSQQSSTPYLLPLASDCATENHSDSVAKS